MSADKIIVLLFAGLYFLFIIYSRRKTSFAEYAVANKSLGSALIFATLAATMIGPAYTMGIVKEGYSAGIYYYLSIMWVGVNYLVMAIFFAKQVYRKFPDALSAGDLIAGSSTHNSKVVKVTIGILVFAQLVFISIFVTSAGGILVSNIFGWDQSISVTVIVVIITAYSYFGGIRATIHTDAFQLAHFVILIPLLILIMVFSKDFSISEYLVSTKEKFSVEVSDFQLGNYLEHALTWLLLGMMHPTTVNRILASNSAFSAKKAMIWTSIFMFTWMFIMVIVGDLGNFLYPGLEESDEILLLLGNNLYHRILHGIFAVAMIGVIMSTQDSILNGASIVFSVDILSVIRKTISNKRRLNYSKRSILIIGVISIFASQYVDSLTDAFIYLTAIFIPTYLPVVVFSVYVRNPRWQAAMASILVGILSSILWTFYGTETGFPTLLFGLVCSSSTYLLVHYLLKRKKIII